MKHLERSVCEDGSLANVSQRYIRTPRTRLWTRTLVTLVRRSRRCWARANGTRKIGDTRSFFLLIFGVWSFKERDVKDRRGIREVVHWTRDAQVLNLRCIVLLASINLGINVPQISWEMTGSLDNSPMAPPRLSLKGLRDMLAWC